jgi:hypothetical protein
LFYSDGPRLSGLWRTPDGDTGSCRAIVVDGGRIVGLISLCKAAVDQLVRVAGAELRVARCSAGTAAFYPGMVDTPMQRTIRAEAASFRDMSIGPGLDSFSIGRPAPLDPTLAAADIVSLAGCPPAEPNGKIWRLLADEWSVA